LTEGDVVTIFSQFGEIMDINLPRDKETGKRRGFGFLMYEDQRSTVLAVDNLNGANILGRTLRVDHVRQYKQKKERGHDGEWRDAEEQSLNAAPALASTSRPGDDSDEDAGGSSGADVDLEDPMAAYFAQKRREERDDEPSSSREKAAEKEAKRLRKEERAQKRARKAERRQEREDADARRSRPREEDERRHRDHHDRDRAREYDSLRVDRDRDRPDDRSRHRH